MDNIWLTKEVFFNFHTDSYLFVPRQSIYEKVDGTPGAVVLRECKIVLGIIRTSSQRQSQWEQIVNAGAEGAMYSLFSNKEEYDKWRSDTTIDIT